MKVVLTLASNSPRRRELLAFGGWMFNVRPVHIDETPLPGEDPLLYVRRMAESKALRAAESLKPGGVAVTADTTVVDGQDILGKPVDRTEAIDMLRRLRGRSHQVHTAIGVVRHADADVLVDICTTNVPMRDYSDDELIEYVNSGDPFDKAGGYAIQHAGFRPVNELTGCYANVVGLPVCHLIRTLQKLNIPASSEAQPHCLKSLGFSCSISAEILSGEN